MAIKIIKGTEPIQIDTIVTVLYSPPGLGKTSLGFSAGALLLDTDKGAHRSAFRADSVRPDSWAEIGEISKEDVEGYNALALDTAGRALDLLAYDIMEDNPKMQRKGGGLSLQGFGVLKARFIEWLKRIRGFGLDVILIAHSDEKNQGDDLIERIDMQGGSKQEVYKSADAMCRLSIDANGKRWLSFSPSDTAFGKDPAGLGRIEVPHLAREPKFMANLIEQIKETLNEQVAKQAEGAEALEAWRQKVKKARSGKALTALIAEAANDREKRALLVMAEEKGYAFDKTKKKFVKISDPDGEDEEADEEEQEEGQTGLPF